MPRRPPRPCAHPGCRELVHGAESRCDRHRRQINRERDDRRGGSTSRGYGSDWQRLRKRKLLTDPYCADCESRGVVTLAEEVDHILTIAERFGSAESLPNQRRHGIRAADVQSERALPLPPRLGGDDRCPR